MDLPVRTHTDMVQASIASAQSVCPELSDDTEGSPYIALLFAVAHLAQWIQFLNFLVLAQTRLGTSNGADADSFVKDFGMERLPDVPATGNVTFTRFDATSATIVPAGTSLKTMDGSLSFTVVWDESKPTWDWDVDGYRMPAGVTSISAKVECDTPGSAGNVLPGTITLIAGALVGVDGVTNPGAFTNGYVGEADDKLKPRFTQYINTRSRATDPAVRYAISSVQQGLSYNVLENTNTLGAFQPGFFTVYVDDGTGSPSADLIGRVHAAVSAVRGFTVMWAVLAPAVVAANVSVTFNAAPGFAKNAVVPDVTAAIGRYVNSLNVGEALSYFKLAQVVQDSSPGVGKINSILVNNAAADVGGGAAQAVRLGTNAVS